MRRVVAVIIVCVTILILVACSDQEAPEPERCSLCGYIPSHAPCLVNLHTGEVGEIALYQPHETLVGEISEEQRGGYFCFMSVAGLKGYLDACVPEAHVSAPEITEKYDAQYFCSSCRELLEDYSQEGYALADLRDPSSPLLYSVAEGTSFTVRCYTVIVTGNDEGELSIMVIGSIPTDG